MLCFPLFADTPLCKSLQTAGRILCFRCARGSAFRTGWSLPFLLCPGRGWRCDPRSLQLVSLGTNAPFSCVDGRDHRDDGSKSAGPASTRGGHFPARLYPSACGRSSCCAPDWQGCCPGSLYCRCLGYSHRCRPIKSSPFQENGRTCLKHRRCGGVRWRFPGRSSGCFAGLAMTSHLCSIARR